MTTTGIGFQHVLALENAVENWFQRSTAVLRAENEEIMNKLRILEDLVVKGENAPALTTLLSSLPLAQIPDGQFYPAVLNGEGLPVIHRNENLPSTYVDVNRMMMMMTLPPSSSSSVSSENINPTSPLADGKEEDLLFQHSSAAPKRDSVWSQAKPSSSLPPHPRVARVQRSITPVGMEREDASREPYSIQQHPLWGYREGWNGDVSMDINTANIPTTPPPPPPSSYSNTTGTQSRTATPIPYHYSVGGGTPNAVGPVYSSSSVFAPSQDSSLFFYPTDEASCFPHFFSSQQPLLQQEIFPLATTTPADPLFVVVQFKVRYERFVSLIDSLAIGDYVVVAGDRGKNIGRVREVHALRREASSLNLGLDNKELKQLFRKATRAEVEALLGNQREAEREALHYAKEIVGNPAFGLNQRMKLVDAEYQFDRRKLTFYYESAVRPDFRQVVRELYQRFHIRIWLEKIRNFE